MDKFIEYIKSTNESFVIDNNNEKVIQSLVSSTNKGVLIIGNFGTGKTQLMKLYCSYQLYTGRPSIRFADVRKICFEFMVNGYKGIEQFYREETSEQKYVYRPFCYDDLGIENSLINYYGTQEDVISNLLYLRHSESAKTYATTNLNIDCLRKRYGDRLFDRFNEMFDIVYLTGKSRR